MTRNPKCDFGAKSERSRRVGQFKISCRDKYPRIFFQSARMARYSSGRGNSEVSPKFSALRRAQFRLAGLSLTTFDFICPLPTKRCGYLLSTACKISPKTAKSVFDEFPNSIAFVSPTRRNPTAEWKMLILRFMNWRSRRGPWLHRVWNLPPSPQLARRGGASPCRRGDRTCCRPVLPDSIRRHEVA